MVEEEAEGGERGRRKGKREGEKEAGEGGGKKGEVGEEVEEVEEEGYFFFSSRRRHTRYISVTGVQTCALPICKEFALKVINIFSGLGTLNSGGRGTI